MNNHILKDVFGFLIFVAIIGSLIWIVFFSDDRKQSQSSTQSTAYQPQTSYPSTAASVPPVNAPAATEPSRSVDTTSSESSSASYELCRVRVVNTLNNTDKTGGYKAVSNEALKTLTLTYINNPDEVLNMSYEGGGIVTMRFYLNGALQAEKTMYRRTDLEHSDKEMVYTSRTEQVQITIMYD